MLTLLVGRCYTYSRHTRLLLVDNRCSRNSQILFTFMPRLVDQTTDIYCMYVYALLDKAYEVSVQRGFYSYIAFSAHLRTLSLYLNVLDRL